MGEGIRTCIVIPCYNEAKSFPTDEYASFLKDHLDVLICFVNDGSTDLTAETLSALQRLHATQVEILSLAINQGKAEAVRQGVIHCSGAYRHEFIAFLDADLSTSLDECYLLQSYMTGKISFVFGSRIMRIGSVIQRKRFRFLVGRVVATFISLSLDLKVYDTQCGCKVFTRELSEYLFAEGFLSRWLFDVELFFRMLIRFEKSEALEKMLEVPLLKWIDRGQSKVKMTYFFKLWIDLFRIRRKYRRNILRTGLPH